jgi:hypothetical protein
MSHPRRRGRALKELRSVRDIIAKIGGDEGNGPIAALTSTPEKPRKTQHVTNWKTEDRLPADTFLVVSAKLAELGYRASPELWGITPVEQE